MAVIFHEKFGHVDANSIIGVSIPKKGYNTDWEFKIHIKHCTPIEVKASEEVAISIHEQIVKEWLTSREM